MRKTIQCVGHSLVVIAVLLSSAAAVRAQAVAYASTAYRTDKSSYQQTKKELQTVLTALEKKYKVSFSFDRLTIKGKEVVAENKSFHSLEEELIAILKPLNLCYEKLDDRIYLILPESRTSRPDGAASGSHAGNAVFPGESPVSYAIAGMAGAKEIPLSVVRGMVTAASGEPLQGASVMVKGSSVGTVTDQDGRFSLNVPDENGMLIFSLVGYITKETNIGGRTDISVSLNTDFKSIGEVVVVGYGTQAKKDLTGSIATVSGNELNKLAATSVDQALQGKLAGVLVTTNSGEPGGGLTVRVRGIGGFGNSEPLYVIDGVIVTYSNSDAASNPLATLNMADIESINVLKDAAASAIYGARAGNGVVIITTKRGRIGKPKIDVDAYYGKQRLAHKLDMMNASEFAQFSNDSRTAAGSPTYSKFANPAALGKGTDWQDVIYRSAPVSDIQLSASGGSDKSQYFISGGYLNQDGIIKGSAFNRYSLRVNLDNQLLPWLKMGTSLALSRTFNNSLTSVGNNDKYDGVVAVALRRSPTTDIYTADGGWAGTSSEADPFIGQIPNPLRIATELNNPTERIRGLGNIYFDVKLLRDLTFRTSLGIDYVLTNADGFQKQVLEESVSNLIRSAYSNKITNSNVLSENTLTYKTTFGTKHALNVLAGYTAQKASNAFVSAFHKIT